MFPFLNLKALQSDDLTILPNSVTFLKEILTNILEFLILISKKV
jgi:hypothetical protein